MPNLEHNVSQPETLPRLITAAAAALTRATTAGEILEARDQAALVYTAAKETARIAKAKQAHEEIIATCRKAMADALMIEARAHCRFADEYDAAQARGEVARHSAGNPQIVPKQNDLLPTAADLGFSGKEIMVARKVRDAEKAKPGRTVVRCNADLWRPSSSAAQTLAFASKAGSRTMGPMNPARPMRP
jgi:hypothetical protein